MGHYSPIVDSFYDFIYLDKVRINTLVAQFSNDNNLSNLKEIIQETEQINPSIHSNLLIENKTSSNSNLSEFVTTPSFDTSWALPIALLNEMSHKIKKTPQKPIAGDLILISGNLLLLDAPTLKKNLPLIKFILEKNHSINRIDNSTKTGIKMTEFLPDTIQLRTKDIYDHKYWMTLDKDNFTINIEHLSLKYGSLLNGDWHILCYVDLTPINNVRSGEESYENYFEYKVIDNTINQPMLNLFISNMEVLKNFGGCNNEEYAVTPIMIFKPVN